MLVTLKILRLSTKVVILTCIILNYVENGKRKNVHLIILNQKGMKLEKEKEKRNELLSCCST